MCHVLGKKVFIKVDICCMYVCISACVCLSNYLLFSVPTSGPQLVYQRPWYVLFCL